MAKFIDNVKSFVNTKILKNPTREKTLKAAMFLKLKP